jgi:hypothetical protein
MNVGNKAHSKFNITHSEQLFLLVSYWLVFTPLLSLFPLGPHLHFLLLYHRESILAIYRLHQTQNNVVKYYVLQFICKI